jgi:hypothetical protein
MSTSSTGTVEEWTGKACALGKELRIINGPSWIRTSDQSGRVDKRSISNHPSPNRACTFQCTRLSSNYFRKRKTPEGSSITSFVTCAPSPCTGHYPGHLSTMGTPSPCVSQRLGDPQVPLHITSVRRFPDRPFTFNQYCRGGGS